MGWVKGLVKVMDLVKVRGLVKVMDLVVDLGKVMCLIHRMVLF